MNEYDFTSDTNYKYLSIENRILENYISTVNSYTIERDDIILNTIRKNLPQVIRILELSDKINKSLIEELIKTEFLDILEHFRILYPETIKYIEIIESKLCSIVGVKI